MSECADKRNAKKSSAIAVGDVVTMKSGSGRLTVTAVNKEADGSTTVGLVQYAWRNFGDPPIDYLVKQAVLPVECVQKVRR